MQVRSPRRGIFRALSMLAIAFALFAGNAHAQSATTRNTLVCLISTEGKSPSGFTVYGPRLAEIRVPIAADGNVQGVSVFSDGVQTYRYTINMQLAPAVPTGFTTLQRLSNGENTRNTISAQNMLWFKQRSNYIFDRHAITPAVLTPGFVAPGIFSAFCSIGLGF